MIIVVTPEHPVENELEIINELFKEGLELLHVRKPHFDEAEMSHYLSEIYPEFYNRTVLHQYHETGLNLGMKRFHFKEYQREKARVKFKGEIFSTSVHQMETFNHLGSEWDYAFLSSMFKSISKSDYGEESKLSGKINQRTNNEVKLIALGGIDESNISHTFSLGVDGVALLGAVWNSENPIKKYNKCRQNVLIY